MPDKQFYVLALQANNDPVSVVTSNPGHALRAGIIDPDKARPSVARFLADDMFNGWGVRTLSHQERSYNPIGYHLGTVWPHDNALIAAGFRRYGFDTAGCRIFTCIVEAAMYFEPSRLPELFAGFPRKDYEVPVRYPVACHPQAWAAGAIPYLLEIALGLTPEAFAQRLRIIRPVLLDFSLNDWRFIASELDLLALIFAFDRPQGDISPGTSSMSRNSLKLSLIVIKLTEIGNSDERWRISLIVTRCRNFTNENIAAFAFLRPRGLFLGEFLPELWLG